MTYQAPLAASTVKYKVRKHIKLPFHKSVILKLNGYEWTEARKGNDWSESKSNDRQGTDHLNSREEVQQTMAPCRNLLYHF